MNFRIWILINTNRPIRSLRVWCDIENAFFDFNPWWSVLDTTPSDEVGKWDIRRIYPGNTGCSTNITDRRIITLIIIVGRITISSVMTSKFYGCHHDLVNRYGVSVSQMTTDMFRLSLSLSDSFLILDLSHIIRISCLICIFDFVKCWFNFFQ
jgi:hypothetical protein